MSAAEEMNSSEDELEVLAPPLDEVLIQAAFGPARWLMPSTSTAHLAGAAVTHPGKVASRAVGLAGELAKVAMGVSEVAPSRGDRRYVDAAWSGNPVLRRIMQAHLATGQSAEQLLAELGLSWRDAERLGFLLTNVMDATAPSNNPLFNPLAWKALIDTGGRSAFTGARNFVRDMSSSPRIPTMVDPKAFTVGKDLAVTPGAVVMRTEMFEMIQYAPRTEKVRELPLLIIPPTINKYYAIDLAPGRSLIEYLVDQGHQVFVLSWRNPQAKHAGWGFNEYAVALVDAFNAVDDIVQAGSVHVVATCSGGMLASITAAEKAALGQGDRLASLSLLVTMIDQDQAGVPAAFASKRVGDASIAMSRRKGYVDGREMAEAFAWLRPNDLIWNYWVSNYLQGQDPPKFDILFWNADTTRMSAALHRDFVESAQSRAIVTPDALIVNGTPIDLRKITVDSYVVAGQADHICPWVNCYRTSQLLGGKVRFVLSSNGHIAALVNPPGNPKTSYRVSDDNSATAEDWFRSASKEQGTWWPDYAAWLTARSGKLIPAPTGLGNAEFPPLEPAPGTYVFEA